MKTLRITSLSSRPFGSNGPEVERNSIGHGQILLSGEYTELAIRHVRKAVEQLQNQGEPDFKKLIRLMRLQLGFIRLEIECGKALLRAPDS